MIRRILIVLLVLLILLAAVYIGAGYYYQARLKPLDPGAVADYRIIEIPVGANSDQIGEIIYRAGLIQDRQVFNFYVRRNNLGHLFIAGRYQLSPSYSVQVIAEKIANGAVYAETVWFTIPEGFTVKQIAQRLETKGLVKAEEFLELARRPSAAIIEAMPELSAVDNPGIDYLLEGYLFPDTYEVFAGAGAEEIIILMLKRMKQVFTAENRQQVEQMGSSIHEILTIAAMVEREARVNHERPLIAGVIYNRLQIDMLLQIDATIQYALGETKEFLTFKDLEVDSPYNTYKYSGLPPGPIANPGEASILAALNPEPSAYLYYNYKYDSSGEHYFSKTYQEHLANVARAEAKLP